MALLKKHKASKLPAKKNTPKTGSIDMSFLILVFILLGCGLVMVCSASYVSAYYNHGDSFYFIKRQAMWALLGVAVMLFFSRFDYRWFKKHVWVILLIAFVMVALVLIPGIGIKVNGARRWLGFGPLRIQPSEIAKLAIIMYLSAYVTINEDKMKDFKKGLLPALLVLILFVGMVAVETHISGAILILAVGVVLLFVGGSSIKTLLSFGGAGVGAIAFLIFFTNYATSRVQTWLDPFSDPQGDGFQTIQSLYAIGSGGFLGLGLGQSRQKHLYIPEPQNDYVFSIVCEELGFVGALVVICLFALLIWYGFQIAFHVKDRFGSMLVVGIISRVAIQTILNIAVVTNAIPCTGIGLPFFSYGGTALCVLMMEMGIVLSVSRHRTPE